MGTTARDRRELAQVRKLIGRGHPIGGIGSDGKGYPLRIEEFTGRARGYGGALLAAHEQVPSFGAPGTDLRSGFALVAGVRASETGVLPARDRAADGQAQRLLGDLHGRVYTTPISNDIVSPYGDLLSKGPMYAYMGEKSAFLDLDVAGSGNALYGDTIEVTDVNYINVLIALRLNEDGGAFSENVNLGIGFEGSEDGIGWYPLPYIDRATFFDPATLIRDDDGQVAGVSPTGGFADASTTMNAPLLEDVLAFLPASASATVAAFVVQRGLHFLVPYDSYVRLAIVPTYSEPPDVTPPSLYVAVGKGART